MSAAAVLPRVEKEPSGTFVLRDLPGLMAVAIRELPAILRPDLPGIRDRLAGTPYPDDEEGTRHWEKYGAPDLAHLFQSAREVVETDLKGMGPEPGRRGRFRLAIPAGHTDAWLSSLSAGRVALAESHGFGSKELEDHLPEEVRTERDQSLLQIHLLGWVQGILIEAGA